MLNGNADQDIDGYDWPDKVRLYQSSLIEHSDDFINNISSLFQRPELSDLTLIIEKQEVKVNRAILAARSDYFHALLYNGMKETCLNKIELPTVELKSFKLLLTFIYSGKLPLNNLTSEELAELLMSARFFCLEKLVCDIALYLKLHINKNNVWSLFKISKLFSIDQLAKACERFFDKNAEIILQHEEFSFLDLEELKAMVGRDSFYASERAILKAICNYYRNNSCGKTQNLELFEELLKPVRLSLISQPEIKAILSSELKLPIHRTQADCYNLADCKAVLPVQNCLSSHSTKRPSALRSPKKKLKLSDQSTPFYAVKFFEDDNQHNSPIQIRDIIIDGQSSIPIENDDCCSITTTNTAITTTTNTTTTTATTTTTTSNLRFPYNCLSLVDFLDITSGMRLREDSIRGYLVYNRNIATKEYKVEPLKGRLKKDLVCSADRNYNVRTCTNHTMLDSNSMSREEYIQVAFGRPFIVNSIRILLLDDGQRSFSYVIETSVDGRNWTTIIDYSDYWCRSWQHLFFNERVVKYVRIRGKRCQFYGVSKNTMSVVYFDCMYNTIDSQMYSLTNDTAGFVGTEQSTKNHFIEPKSSIVEINNTIAITSSSNGTMRHFRLRGNKSHSTSSITTSSSIPTSPNPHNLSMGISSPTDNSINLISANANHNGSPLINQLSLHYRATDFARGSATWNSPGKVIFQLAQPFKISSFAFKINTPITSGGSHRSHLSYNVSISNDFEEGPWKMIKEITRASGKDLSVVEFEPQIVTFIEIRSIDYPNLSHFSVKHFECPYITERN